MSFILVSTKGTQFRHFGQKFQIFKGHLIPPKLAAIKTDFAKKMQIQSLSHLNCTLAPPNFSLSSHNSSTLQPAKLVSNWSLPSGFCSSLRRASKSLAVLRRYGGPVGIRCGAMQEGNIGDEFYMRRCVELARKAIGCTSPNPMVGCVIVKDGKIVGEGFHPKAGQPHAEVFALRDAGDLAENATAYVSLEPCNHYGRTPPCTEAMIKAKVKRLVVGMVDPNPIVASKGLNRLRSAGIDVTVGVEEELCKRLNEAYIHQMLTGKPFLTLRYSLSVNGHFLNQLGEGVTETGGYYSQLLQEYDAVIVSSSLNEKCSIPESQEPGANQPFQIIIANNPSSPIQLPSLTKERASKLKIFADKETAIEPEMAQKGFEIVILDRINLTAVLEYCKRQGLCSVLLDLRGSFGNLEDILAESVEDKLLQKIVIELLPLWDGTNTGNRLLALNSAIKGLKVKNFQSKISGQSVVVEGYL